jgi:uncharacterized protein (TIGR03435 family)
MRVINFISLAAIAIGISGLSICLLSNVRIYGASTKPALRYDIISIKPANPNHRGRSIGGTDDTFSAVNVNVELLIENAYGLRQDYIHGIPPSIDDKRFDIVAKTTEASPDALKRITGNERMAMLQALLGERFHLKVHESTKVLTVFAITQAKGGPKFGTGSSAKLSDTKMAAGSIVVNNGELTAHAVPMSSLIGALTGVVQKNIVDQTNLAGVYDFHLRWNPSQDMSGIEYTDPSGLPTETMPSIFTALQEQLGLKLVPTKAPVKILVVDHVESPETN